MDNDTQTQAAEPALAQQSAAAAAVQPDPIQQAAEPAQIASAEQRPEWLPEKFWNKDSGKAEFDKLAISYTNLEKMAMGKKAAPTKPGSDATPEQIQQYYADLRKITGAPEKPEDYGLKAPEKMPEGVEWNADLAGKAAAIAHKYGMPPEALHELIALNNDNMSSLVSKSQEAYAANVQQMIDGLNKEWGESAKNNWQRANRGAIALGIDTSTSDLGNNPEFIKAMVRVDQMIREDSGLIGTESDSSSTYEEQISRMQKSDDFQGKNGPEKQMAALSRIEGLYRAMHAK
jgi:hypothetical protein